VTSYAELRSVQPVAGGDICNCSTGRLADGRTVFVKRLATAPPGFFAAEARGLDWLRTPAGPPLPAVLDVADDALVLEWVGPGPATPQAAERFGRDLARLHQSAPPSFGAECDGYIGTLPLGNSVADSWPEFYATHRLVPYLGALTGSQRAMVDRLLGHLGELAGPVEPPARVHGDLWSGNVVWSAGGRGWLVDAAAAHGGHRETDLAMLALFGAPYLDRIIAAYDEVLPLAEGWQQRRPLHQLHPLLVHATLFGGGYGARAADAAAAALALR
jgi:fructosamine-3-kinase